jgi:hypothetical protein
MPDSVKGQSLDGNALDLDLLDSRVQQWKEELGLIHQPEFPPKNVKISDDGVKFHDRSHILVQDYLGKTSYDFREIFEEKSAPSVYEEILAFFCAKVTHHPDIDPRIKTTRETIKSDILLMEHLGYLESDSRFIRERFKISGEIGASLSDMVDLDDFPLFRKTLLASTKDCERWEDLEILRVKPVND